MVLKALRMCEPVSSTVSGQLLLLSPLHVSDCAGVIEDKETRELPGSALIVSDAASVYEEMHYRGCGIGDACIRVALVKNGPVWVLRAYIGEGELLDGLGTAIFLFEVPS